MSPDENFASLTDQCRLERRCKIVLSGLEYFHHVPAPIAPKAVRRTTASAARWKSVWVLCTVGIAVLVSSGVAISRSGPIDATHASASTVPVRTAGRISHDNPKCLAAKRNIDAYSRAVGQLDPWRASHRRLAAIYHEAWQAKHDWYRKNCR